MGLRSGERGGHCIVTLYPTYLSSRVSALKKYIECCGYGLPHPKITGYSKNLVYTKFRWQVNSFKYVYVSWTINFHIGK